MGIFLTLLCYITFSKSNVIPWHSGIDCFNVERIPEEGNEKAYLRNWREESGNFQYAYSIEEYEDVWDTRDPKPQVDETVSHFLGFLFLNAWV